jgi:hypothetical protein
VQRDGLWWKGAQLVIPSFSAYIEHVLDAMHDSPIAGHMGQDKTLAAVSRLWWWPSMRRDVQEYAMTWDSCQRNKGDLRKKG